MSVKLHFKLDLIEETSIRDSHAPKSNKKARENHLETRHLLSRYKHARGTGL